MTKEQIKLEKQGYNFNCNQFTKGSHVANLLLIGRCFPTCKTQAKKWTNFCVLNLDDVEVIEILLNKHNLKGNYKYTKSKFWVRLINENDFKLALKKEYNY
jgi:hypothetical protein